MGIIFILSYFYVILVRLIHRQEFQHLQPRQINGEQALHQRRAQFQRK